VNGWAEFLAATAVITVVLLLLRAERTNSEERCQEKLRRAQDLQAWRESNLSLMHAGEAPICWHSDGITCDGEEIPGRSTELT
jgi:hypothetical protein